MSKFNWISVCYSLLLGYHSLLEFTELSIAVCDLKPSRRLSATKLSCSGYQPRHGCVRDLMTSDPCGRRRGWFSKLWFRRFLTT
jgi:hypothetical protein